MTLIKTVGDMLPAGQGCEFYFKVFGFNVNEGWCGIGGLVSALLTSYDLYQWGFLDWLIVFGFYFLDFL